MIRWIAALVTLPVLASADEGFQLPPANIRCLAVGGAPGCDVTETAYCRPRVGGDSVERGPARLVGGAADDPSFQSQSPAHPATVLRVEGKLGASRAAPARGDGWLGGMLA